MTEKIIGVLFAAFFSVFVGHYLATEKIIDSCADFEKFKSRGIIYECKPVGTVAK
jgi:hypothetical protein